MSEKIATQILTNDINLVALLSELESCRVNGLPKHKVCVYRSGKHYNIIADHEHSKYLVEITNDKKGDEEEHLRAEYSFGFKAEIRK